MKYLPLLLLLLSFNAFAVPLTGEPPTQREDNTPFNLETELHGFNVYCGLITKDYVDSYTFQGYALPKTTWDVDLPAGVHYCAVTTVDTDGRESSYSNEVTVTVTVDAKYPPKSPNVVETIINIIITLPQPTTPN